MGKKSGTPRKDVKKGPSLTPRKTPSKKTPSKQVQVHVQVAGAQAKGGKGAGVQFSYPLVTANTTFDPALPIVPGRKSRSPSASAMKLSPLPSALSPMSPTSPGTGRDQDQTWSWVSSPGPGTPERPTKGGNNGAMFNFGDWAKRMYLAIVGVSNSSRS